MTQFGNLVFSGLTSGAIYAVFAVCLAFWFLWNPPAGLSTL